MTRMRLAPKLVVSLSAALSLLAASGCGGKKAVDPGAPPPPPQAIVPMDLAGQPVLVLPVQAVSGLSAEQDEVTSEILFALTEKDRRTNWIGPDRLRSSLRRAPGYAQDPGYLPADDYRHNDERYIVDPLASVVRRYSALMDARLVLIPRSAAYLPAPDGSGGMVRIDAALVDSRSGRVVWYGEADGAVATQGDVPAVASAAAALAARMLAPREGS